MPKEVSKESLEEFGIEKSLTPFFKEAARRGKMSISEIIDITPADVFKDCGQAEKHIDRITGVCNFFGIEVVNGDFSRIPAPVPEPKTKKKKSETKTKTPKKAEISQPKTPSEEEAEPPPEELEFELVEFESFLQKQQKTKQKEIKLTPGQSYYYEISKFPKLDWRTEIELIEKAQSGDEKSRDRVVYANLRFVVFVARKHAHKTGSGLDFLDLVQEGNIGLLKAIDRFNKEKDTTIRTYAWWWITQRINRLIYNQSKTIRLPVYTYQNAINLKKTMTSYERKFKRKASLEELANAMDWSVRKTLNTLEIINSKTVSANQETFDHDGVEGGELIDFIPNPKAINPEKAVEVKEQIQLLRNVIFKIFNELQRSPIRHRNIFLKRYGLDGSGYPQTLEATGIYFGLTRERVRQICEKINRKLWTKIKPEGVKRKHFDQWLQHEVAEAIKIEAIAEAEGEDPIERLSKRSFDFPI